MSEAALNYCRDRALYPGSPLALTQLFTPPVLHAPVLATQGLLADLLDIPEEVSEPSVGYAKLGWWREELSGEISAQARHPALQAVVAARPGLVIPAPVVVALLDGLRQVLERSVYTDEQSLWQDCLRVGGASMALQMAVLGEAEAPAALREAYALHYFLRLIHRFNHSGGSAPWPFPLTLQARHQVNQQTLAAQGVMGQWAGLSAMIQDLVSFAEQQLPSRGQVRRAATPAALPGLLLHHLERRLLTRYRSQPQRLMRVGGQRWSPADAFSLWWQSQRLRHLRQPW